MSDKANNTCLVSGGRKLFLAQVLACQWDFAIARESCSAHGEKQARAPE